MLANPNYYMHVITQMAEQLVTTGNINEKVLEKMNLEQARI